MLSAAQAARQVEQENRGRVAVQWLMAKSATDEPGHAAILANFRERTRGQQHDPLLATATEWIVRTMDPDRRAAVPAVSNGDLPETELWSAYAATLRPKMLIGKLATTAAPFATWLPVGVTGATGYWKAEGVPIPVSRPSFEKVQVPRTKVVSMTVTTEETVRGVGPAYEALIRKDLDAALIQKADETFIDGKPGGFGRPASILHGVPPLPTTGTVDGDTAALLDAIAGADEDLTTAAFIASTASAIAVGGLRDGSGGRLYPGVGPLGGTLAGLPLHVSTVVPDDLLALVVGREIYLADEGADLELFRHADVAMDDAPTGSLDPPEGLAPAPLGTWQNNAVGIRARQFLGWQRARDTAAAWVSGFVPAALAVPKNSPEDG